MLISGNKQYDELELYFMNKLRIGVFTNKGSKEKALQNLL